MSHNVAYAATTTIILLLTDTECVADTGDYYSIARFAPFQDEALDPFDNFLSSLHDLLLHRRNRFLKTLLDDNGVNRNLVKRCFLFDLVSFRSDPADGCSDAFADFA